MDKILSEIPWEALIVLQIDQQRQINQENLGQYTDFKNFIRQKIKTLYVINRKIKRPICHKHKNKRVYMP